MWEVARETPILFDWPKLATTDEATIRGWWSRWPLANIGLAMGGGVVAVDIDCIYALEALEDHGLPGATPTQHTGSGGLHKLYRYAKSRDLKNAVRFQEGVDLRTDGGFIIAAPSVNTKGSYHWDGDLDISTPLAELPQWIADACAVGVDIHRPPLQITDLWAGVPEGTRNGHLFFLRLQDAPREAARAGDPCRLPRAWTALPTSDASRRGYDDRGVIRALRRQA